MKEADALRETLAAMQIDLMQTASATVGQRTLDPRLSDAPAPPLPTARIELGGDFEPREELGRGAMGIVELATQRALSRDVAIKRLLQSSPELVDSLLHEAVIAGQLEHPNIVPIHAVVTDGVGPAVVMKRISGVEWAELLTTESLDRHLQIFVQVCSAVAFAHSRGIVHRDIKPANVMIGEFDEVYLVDWGLARRLDANGIYTGRIAGTPAYIAPEMVTGESLAQSDIFLLGATLHELLTGKPRHLGTTLVEVLSNAQAAEPFDYDQNIDPELAEICNRACARDPNTRFADVSKLRDAIRLHLENRTAAALLHAAKERAEALEASLSEDYPTTQRLFNEARFAFDQAAKARPDHEDTRDSRDACLELMARHELSYEHPEIALSLVESMSTPHAGLKQAAEVALERMRQERARLEALERDRDPEVGVEERRQATFALAAAVMALVGAFVGLRVMFPMYASDSMRLLLIGAIVFVVGTAVMRQWQKRSELNLINRRISQIVIGTISLSLFNRVTSYIGGSDVAEILLRDALLQIGCGLALLPFHPGGRGLVIAATLVASVGAVRPEWLEWMFIGLAVIIPAVFLLTRRKTALDSSSD